MEDDDHIAQLGRGLAHWNAWRDENVNIRPDLSEAKLSKASVGGANLKWANHSNAELTRTDLRMRTSGMRPQALFWFLGLRPLPSRVLIEQQGIDAQLHGIAVVFEAGDRVRVSLRRLHSLRRIGKHREHGRGVEGRHWLTVDPDPRSPASLQALPISTEETPAEIEALPQEVAMRMTKRRRRVRSWTSTGSTPSSTNVIEARSSQALTRRMSSRMALVSAVSAQSRMESGIPPSVLDAIQDHAPRTASDSYGDVTVKAMAQAMERVPKLEV